MDDEKAIEKCLRGEKEAFRFSVERYQTQAAGHAAAILGNREDARHHHVDCRPADYYFEFRPSARNYQSVIENERRKINLEMEKRK
jgi:hypothetical protein